MKKKKTRKIGKELPESAAESLKDLRQNIDSIDREILGILIKRQSQVEQMISLKKAYNLQVYHPAREEDMISDRRRLAQEVGLNPDYLEELFRAILRQSRVEQTDSMAGKGLRPGSTVLLVGGTRGMGKYFHHWFSKSEYRVRSMGSNDWHRIDILCDGVDLAVISVPIDVTVPVIQKIGPHLPPGCLLTDLTSIKGPPMKAMMESQDAALAAFAPGDPCSKVDKAARTVFKKHGVWNLVQHHTGHAIGLEGHEKPFLDHGMDVKMEPGMVFTVEPGIYDRSIGGFRHSDTVFITEDGMEQVTYYPRDIDYLTIPLR